MNAVCPECDLEYAMKQEALDRLGCMYCPWSGAQEKRPGDLRQDTNRTAPTETPIERNSVMSESTTRRDEQNHSDEPPQVKGALNRWAEGKATFGDLMLASQDAGVDPGPVMQKAMEAALGKEALDDIRKNGWDGEGRYEAPFKPGDASAALSAFLREAGPQHTKQKLAGILHSRLSLTPDEVLQRLDNRALWTVEDLPGIAAAFMSTPAGVMAAVQAYMRGESTKRALQYIYEHRDGGIYRFGEWAIPTEEDAR